MNAVLLQNFSIFIAECGVPVYMMSAVEFNDGSKGTERIRDLFKVIGDLTFYSLVQHYLNWI